MILPCHKFWSAGPEHCGVSKLKHDGRNVETAKEQNRMIPFADISVTRGPQHCTSLIRYSSECHVASVWSVDTGIVSTRHFPYIGPTIEISDQVSNIARLSVVFLTTFNSVAWFRERTYRLGDRRLSAKLVPNFADRGCHVVNVTDPYGRTLVFLDRRRYFFFQVAPQLYSRGWVGPRSRPTPSQKIW
jgi:hypothetical protein